MHLLVLGATGKTGALAYLYALERGNHVTILVRNASLITPHADLTVVEGSAMSEADMDRAFAAAGVPVDAVLQCLNPHRAADHPWAKFLGPPRLLADSTALAARALRRQGCQPGGRKPRLIAMNALGAGQSRKAAPIITKFLIDYSNVGCTYVDHNAVDAEIEGNCGNEIDWTIVFPVALSGGGGGLVGGPNGLKPVKTFAHTDPGSNWFITRESCARWMVEVASGNLGDEFRNKRIIVSN